MRYIGSKTKVLPFIQETVAQTFGNVCDACVADLFSGTGCVAEHFKALGAKVITNDYMSFSYALQIAKIKLNMEPSCEIDYDDAIEELNQLDEVKGFFYKQYSMDGTKDGAFSRNYFSAENAAKIDAIRTKIGQWHDQRYIDIDMFYLLCASLVDSITQVSNTTGTYGAFLKSDDQRKYKAIKLAPFEFMDNFQENECYCEDIFNIIDVVEGDILYLDPPYNSRQYPPYYHILETAVVYDNPAIYGVTGRRPYQSSLSPLCIKGKAFDALLDIIKRAKFQHIYVSYSTDGIIDYVELCNALKQFAEVQCFFKPYRRYKSNSAGEEKTKLKEMIIYVKKGS